MPALPQFSNPNQIGQPPGRVSITGTANGSNAIHYNPPEQHLVRGQLGILQNENGQYLKQARQKAMELANARGQANSDYAAGSAQRAAIDAALPIAAQDSETLTRIGLTNAAADQKMKEMEMMANARSAAEGGQTVIDMTGEEEANRQHQLQLQRERLAFEGEQSGLGRAHDYGMGLMGMEGDLFGQQMGFGHQRQLGFDQYGFDLGRMGQEFGYNQQLARLGAALGLQSDYLNNQWGMQRDQGQMRNNLYMNSLLQGMQVPEFMANPEALLGFTQAILGFNFNQIFGGRG